MKKEYIKSPSRRSFLTRTWELAATIPLVGFIAQNFMNRTSYYSIDDSGAQFLEEKVSDLAGVRASSVAFGSSLSDLSSNYRRAYHKRHTRVVPSVGPKGKIRLRTEVYYRWEEPSNVPDHTEVESWLSDHDGFSNRLSSLKGEARVDLKKLEGLAVVRETTGAGKEGLASLAIYTPQIAALLFYEEGIAKMRHEDYTGASAEELVDRNDTRTQISRRSFFKALAAFGSAFTASAFADKNSKKIEEGKERLEAEIEKLKSVTSLGEEEAFLRYFGREPKQLIEAYRRQTNIAKTLSENGVHDGGVSRSFGVVASNGEVLVKSLEGFFREGVPKSVGDEVKSALIFRDLKDKSLSENRAVYTGLGITGLAVAGTIAGILVPLEIANEYYANKFEKK